MCKILALHLMLLAVTLAVFPMAFSSCPQPTGEGEGEPAEGEGEGEGEPAEGEGEGEGGTYGLNQESWWLGDSNLDGVIDANDASYALQLTGGTIQLDPDAAQWDAADTDGDGAVTSYDTLAIILYVRSGGLVLDTPQRLRAESGANEVALFWRPVPHANLVKYAVYRRSITKNTDWRIIGVADDTFFADTGIDIADYEYAVAAVDVFGNVGEVSDGATVTANTIRVWIPHVIGLSGGDVRIPINFGNARGFQPRSMNFQMRYDPAVLEYTGLDKTILTQEVELLDSDDGQGRLSLVSVDPETDAQLLGGEGRFFDLYFRVSDTVATGCVDVTFDENADGEPVLLLDLDDQRYATQREDGSLCVAQTGLWGDVDNDGDIDHGDAELMLDIAVGLIDATDHHYKAGDLNGDGRLDSADAVLIQRTIENLALNPDTAGWLGFNPGGRAFSMASRTTAQGGRVWIPVTLSEVEGLAGGDLIFAWPSGELEFHAIELAPLLEGLDIAVDDGPGYASVSGGSTQGIGAQADAKLFDIVFDATGNVTDTHNPAPVVRLNYAELKGAYGESYRWYGALTRTRATVTITESGMPCEGEGEGGGALLAAYCFRGDLGDASGHGYDFVADNVVLEEDGIYLNGVYEFSAADDAYKAETPNIEELDYGRFSVSLDFKVSSQRTLTASYFPIIVGGSFYRWFSVFLTDENVLGFSLNNQTLIETTSRTVQLEKWYNLFAELDVHERSLVIRLDGVTAVTYVLPEWFQLRVVQDAVDYERTFLFQNLSNGTAFHGHVDNLIIRRGEDKGNRNS